MTVPSEPPPHRVLSAAPMERSSKSKVVTVMVTAIWAGAVAVIITDGAEAEDTITTTGD